MRSWTRAPGATVRSELHLIERGVPRGAPQKCVRGHARQVQRCVQGTCSGFSLCGCRNMSKPAWIHLGYVSMRAALTIIPGRVAIRHIRGKILHKKPEIQSKLRFAPFLHLGSSSRSFFHPQPPSLPILLSEPGSASKVLTKET